MTCSPRRGEVRPGTSFTVSFLRTDIHAPLLFLVCCPRGVLVLSTAGPGQDVLPHEPRPSPPNRPARARMHVQPGGRAVGRGGASGHSSPLPASGRPLAGGQRGTYCNHQPRPSCIPPWASVGHVRPSAHARLFLDQTFLREKQKRHIQTQRSLTEAAGLPAGQPAISYVRPGGDGCYFFCADQETETRGTPSPQVRGLGRWRILSPVSGCGSHGTAHSHV